MTENEVANRPNHRLETKISVNRAQPVNLLRSSWQKGWKTLTAYGDWQSGSTDRADPEHASFKKRNK